MKTAVLTDLEQVMDVYGDMVFRTAYTLVKNKPDAEDVAQEVFLSLLRTQPVFESAEHQKAWLLRATINRCKSFFRSAWQSKTQALAEDFPAEAFTGEELGVMQAVGALKPRYREVVYLYYIQGYAVKEIATLLRVPQNTVLSRMARARALLKDALKGVFDDEL